MQQRAQTVEQEHTRTRDREEQLRSLRTQVFEELQHNHGAIEQLQQILSKTLTARTDIWEWASRVVESFEFSARGQFEMQVLTLEERAHDAGVALAYRELRRLLNRVRQATAAHSFFYGFSADVCSANWQLGEILQFTKIVASELKIAIDWIQKTA